MKFSKVFFITAIFICAAPLYAAQFSADTRSVRGGRTVENRFFYAEDRWRVEERLPKGEYRVTIFRQDQKSLFVLWPDKKRYIVQPLPEKEFAVISMRRMGEELERVELGQEKLSGYLTKKYRVKYKVLDKVITCIEWFSKELDVVVRSQADDRSWSTELTNIREDSLDGNLFEIPAGYEQLSSQDIFPGPKQKPSKN